MPRTSYMLGTVENYTDLVETISDNLIFFTPFPAWIFTILCVIGAIGNLINMIVLTRPKMISPINILLTFVEGSNFFIFLYFVPALIAPYTYTFNVSFSSVVIKVIQTSGESITLCISSWLSVFIASWRYIAVEWPLKAQIVCSKKNTILAIVIVVVFSIIIDIPEMITMMNYDETIFTIDNETELYNSAKRNVSSEFDNGTLNFPLANQEDHQMAEEYVRANKMKEMSSEMFEDEKAIEPTTVLTAFKYWSRLAIGGLCLPFVFPWLVYWLYQNRLRYRVQRNRVLEDKVVLITGASSGLGEALAHEFYKAGCKVILAARRQDELNRVKKDLMNIKLRTLCYEPAVLCIDLGNLKEIPGRANDALSFHGKVDILVNNGGISYRGEALNTSLDVDLKVMVVNYFGHIVLTKALLPEMLKQGEGQIVAISSIQGKIAIPFRSAYAASKHAVQAFFDTLRAELGGTNIHVCVVSPGYIKTNLSFNAVTGDGSSHGVLDTTTATGMDPVLAAEEIVQGIALKKGEMVLSSAMPKLAIWLRWFWPSAYFYLMKKRAQRLRKLESENKTD